MKKIILLAIIGFSFFLRFYKLESLPQAFFTDEAALGYNGWSLMTTMKDEYGQFLPLTMRSFDDYKPAVYSYLTIPFIAVSGLTQATSRAPAALFGALLPLFIYLLIERLTKNKSLALISSLVVVLTPWHIEISRTAIEAGVALSLTIFALLMLARKKVALGLIALLITLFTYHTARIIAPIIILAALFFKVLKISKVGKIFLYSITALGILLAVTASSSRFGQISIFSDQESKLLREEAIREDGGPIKTSLLATRIFHNKPLSAIQAFSKSYISNTSLSYLFLGGAQPPRATIPETGQFLLFFLPFFILGLAASIKSSTNFDKWLLFWLFFAPVPASLTTAEIPHTYRTLFMLPPIAIFIARGILTSLSFVKKLKLTIKIKKNFLPAAFSIFIVVATGLNFYKSWHQYSVHQQVHQPWYRQYGYQDLIKYLSSIPDAENITVTNRENEPYMMVLFYNQIEPIVYQNLAQKRLSHESIEDQGKETWQMFNYTFSEKDCPHNLDDKNENNYYVVMFTCELPVGFERVKAINFLDGNPEFYVDRPLVIKNN
ncbi:MAG: hypothetical protein HN846_01445 [Candidatus Pacebacteria bacterium]|nr:hypothetical protein [Candidatus Paceibacterota bacterium]